MQTRGTESDCVYNELVALSPDLRQIRELDSIESDTLWLLFKKVKKILLCFLRIPIFDFFTDKICLNSEPMFEACFTEDVVNFLLSEYTGAK